MPEMLDAMIRLATCVPEAIESVAADLPVGFPEHVWEAITTGLAKASQTFLTGLDGAG